MKTSFLENENNLNALEDRIRALKNTSSTEGIDVSKEIDELIEQKNALFKESYANLSAYDIVQIARHPLRPSSTDYIDLILEDFTELHGDRRYGDDKAIICGIGKLHGRNVMLIGHWKGKSTKERISCNFGMPNPEGYRKALLKMKLAEKFKLPIITLIDTPGANPDIGAEERGQAQAIAENIYEMFMLKTPIISVVIGEGGSGGALGIGVCDRFAILEYAYFSVISPEGCAAILWKHSKHAPKSAEALKLTSKDLKRLEIVDEIIPEPLGSANRNPKEMAGILKNSIIKNLDILEKIPIQTLLDERYNKYRKIGQFFEKV